MDKKELENKPCNFHLITKDIGRDVNLHMNFYKPDSHEKIKKLKFTTYLKNSEREYVEEQGVKTFMSKQVPNKFICPVPVYEKGFTTYKNGNKQLEIILKVVNAIWIQNENV